MMMMMMVMMLMVMMQPHTQFNDINEELNG